MATGPFKISYKKDSCQRRPYKFHVSWPPTWLLDPPLYACLPATCISTPHIPLWDMSLLGTKLSPVDTITMTDTHKWKYYLPATSFLRSVKRVSITSSPWSHGNKHIVYLKAPFLQLEILHSLIIHSQIKKSGKICFQNMEFFKIKV